MNSTQQTELLTVDDLKMIIAAAWDVGACNLLGMSNSLPGIIQKARRSELGDQHPAVKLFIGHMAYLAGVGLGPDPQWAEEVRTMIAEMSEVTTNEV